MCVCFAGGMRSGNFEVSLATRSRIIVKGTSTGTYDKQKNSVSKAGSAGWCCSGRRCRGRSGPVCGGGGLVDLVLQISVHAIHRLVDHRCDDFVGGCPTARADGGWGLLKTLP